METLPLLPLFMVKMQKIVICPDKDRLNTLTKAQFYLQAHSTFLGINSDWTQNGDNLLERVTAALQICNIL